MAIKGTITSPRRAESIQNGCGLRFNPCATQGSKHLGRLDPICVQPASDPSPTRHAAPAITGCDAAGLFVMLTPREQLSFDLRALPLRTPAAYLLLNDDWADVAMARAGETLDVRNRLAHHMRDRKLAWFTRGAIIYGPAVDKRIAHAMQYFLHSHLVAAGRCDVMSGVDANPPSRTAFQAALGLFERARLYLSVAGVDLLEERTVHDSERAIEPDDPDGFVTPFDAERVWVLKDMGYRAAVAEAGGCWAVLAGSEIRAQAQPSARPRDIRVREELARDRALEPVHGRPDVRVLSRDVTVRSLDDAGKFVLGSPRSVTRAWEEIRLDARSAFRA
jgi:hypothetical protein